MSNVFVFEEDVTSWDFWKNDSNDDGADAEGHAETGDLGSTLYDVAFEAWIERASWTRREASALTFGRNPDAINWDGDYPSEIEDELISENRIRRSVFLRFAIGEVCDKIRSAQDLGILPQKIAPRQFVAWSTLFRLDVPYELRNALVADHARITAAPNVSPQFVNGSRSSDKTRLDNNLLKIILALLLMEGGRDEISISTFAHKIERRLDELQKEIRPEKGALTFESQSIVKRLKDVRALLGDKAHRYFVPEK